MGVGRGASIKGFIVWRETTNRKCTVFLPCQLSQQEERERLRKMAEELKKEMEDKERSQQQLSQAIVDKEQELIKAREYVSLCLSLCLCLSVSFSVCLSLSLSPPPPPILSLSLFFLLFFFSFFLFLLSLYIHSLELAIVDKEQELIKAREYVSVSPAPPPPPLHTLSFLPCVFLVFLSFFLSFLFTVPMHSCGGDITIYTCCIYI